jgi:hypothetical protein
MRKILESVTGVFTGTDMDLTWTLDQQQHGMLGEQIQDDSVWVTKTHFPMMRFERNEFKANKLIYITRHPVDVFASQATLMLGASHSLEPAKPWNEFKIWPHFVKNYIPLFRDFHAYLERQSKKTPTFFLTYEDLVFN